MVQLGKCISQILSVDQLVGRILKAHLPAVRRARRGRDEEELAGVGESEVLVALVDGRGFSKVDAALLAHDGLIIPDLADVYCGLLIEEGDDDAAEGLKRGEGVDGRRVGDEVTDDIEVLGEEDGRVGEVGEEKGVGRRRRRGQRWEVGEVESKV
jgi:hypothetical protein